jgi:hypothetical protein
VLGSIGNNLASVIFDVRHINVVLVR